MEVVEIIQSGSGNVVANLNLSATATIYDIKKEIQKRKRNLYPERQALRLELKGRILTDETLLRSLEFRGSRQLFLKDLGPQIGWRTVFLWEYTGPLVLYLITYSRPLLIYGSTEAAQPMQFVVHVAALCWIIHYSKRLLETLFVHRFSHATMPLRNLFKNCVYYWLFGLYIGYYVNHPLYTPPTFGKVQLYIGLAGFLYSELGNFSIHMALRNLRSSGSKERKIPLPTTNPFTLMFNFVSCPNYTYEVMSWIFFTVMTQCLPAGFFTLAGFYQMTAWALGKHRNYKKEFPTYPKRRKAIIPYIL